MMLKAFLLVYGGGNNVRAEDFGKHKPASATSLLCSLLFQAVSYMCRCERAHYLSSIVLDAKLVVIHSGLDIVRVCLRRKDTDLHAAVHVCITIWYSQTERMPAVRCVAAA